MDLPLQSQSWHGLPARVRGRVREQNLKFDISNESSPSTRAGSPCHQHGFQQKFRFPILFSVAACVFLIIGGCRSEPINRSYHGPTSRMYEVVTAVNGNNGGIQTIWTDHTFKAWIHDDKGKSHYVDGDGVLLYRKQTDKPDELLLQGEAPIVGKIFEIGSSSGPQAQYWVAVVPEIGTEWWGYYKNLGKPCVRSLPIHPDLVVEVLGVNQIDENFLRPPVPAMRFNNDADVYMFTFSVQTPTRWVIQKEVWYSRKMLLPVKVLLFDENGRVLLRADLSEHEPIDGGDGRKIATQYKLFFPENKDRLEFSLKSPKLTRKGLPRAGTIQRRPIGDVREIRIDEECGD